MATGAVTLYIATSVDGYIADAEGKIEWLSEFPSTDDLGFSEFFETVDCLVMGSTTYEQVLGFGEWPYGEKPTYVFTSQERSPATNEVTFVNDAVAQKTAALKEQFDHIWLVGGASLTESFLNEQQVDTLQLTQLPVLLGEGIPLFAGGYDRQRLELNDTTSHEGGVVELTYKLP